MTSCAIGEQVVTAAQFMALWESTGLDRMPYPLRYRPGAPTAGEHDHEQECLQEWITHSATGATRSCIDALRNPDVSVTVCAPHTDEHPAIRRRGCVRMSVAVLAEQYSMNGKDGDIRLSSSHRGIAHNLEALAVGLVGDLPPRTAGRVTALRAHPDDVSLSSNTSVFGSPTFLLRSPIASAGERMRLLLDSPRSGTGHICVRGPRRGLAEPLVHEMTWIDVQGDGRYLYHVDHDVHLRPVSPVEVYDELLRRIRSVVGPRQAGRSTWASATRSPRGFRPTD